MANTPSELERYKVALQTIACGDAPRVRHIIYRTDGQHSKHDKCIHMRVMYDDCDECTAEYARFVLNGGDYAYGIQTKQD